MRLEEVLESSDDSIYEVQTRSAGPAGLLPLSDAMLRELPSGDLFGLSQNAGMGWSAAEVARKPFLILSTQGGIRAADGTPVALGYHTGHYEVGLLMEAAAREIKSLGGLPFAGFCSDPCDGRTQGTTGMMDSLAYRNDASMVLRRLIRSLPTRRGVIGVATCDKGLPAMMMALAGCGELPSVLVPGGVSLPPLEGEDAGKIQTIGVRYVHGEITLDEAADLGCRACASPGGGCQFLGTAATSQVVAEALGMTVVHAALAPSGQSIWANTAVRSARAVMHMEQRGIRLADILTDDAFHNAMVVHAAFGGSTNLVLHIPAVAYHAGRTRMTVADWQRVNNQTPRIVDVLPNGPVGHPTVCVFLAGGVPEVMLHLRRLGLLRLECMTVSCCTLGEALDGWERSERRRRLRERLQACEGVDANDVIYSPERAAECGLAGTVTFPRGNVAPSGSVVKSTAIDRRLLDEGGVYRKVGGVRVFTSERAAIAAVKGSGPDRVQPGQIIVLVCAGPLGSGMEETYQITSALKHAACGDQISLVTDARFSGVSTGPCIGHVGPEALAGGPIGKLIDDDLLEIVIDTRRLIGSVNLVGHGETLHDAAWGDAELSRRELRADLAADPRLPADTRLWAALQEISGGTWGGCVYDVEAIVARLRGNVGDRPSPTRRT